MRPSHRRWTAAGPLFAVVLGVLPAADARAQSWASPWQPTPNCPAYPSVLPQPQPGRPSDPTAQPGTPPAGQPSPGSDPATNPAQNPADNQVAALGNESFAAGGGESGAAQIGAGYVDPAWVRTQVRLRYDSGYRDNRPDRAEFFYAGPAGPRLPERSVDFQDLMLYAEAAWDQRWSAFVELPVRWLNPQINPNAAGYGDMNVGFKVGILTDPTQLLTFQLRTYLPTGNPTLGLGTAHASVEPGVLYHRQWDRLYFDGEFKAWVPLTDNNFAGTTLRYGAGLSYNLARCPKQFLAPVAELVGWTVLDGRESVPGPFGMENSISAAGDTIVNAKFGVRYGWDLYNSLYLGYGRALTGDVWYKDIIRLEYRRAF